MDLSNAYGGLGLRVVGLTVAQILNRCMSCKMFQMELKQYKTDPVHYLSLRESFTAEIRKEENPFSIEDFYTK